MFWETFKLIYLIGQNFVGQNFRWTKYFVEQNIRHQAVISTILSDFFLTFVLKYWTKFSTDKIFRRTKFSTQSRNFDNFCPTNFCAIRYVSPRSRRSTLHVNPITDQLTTNIREVENWIMYHESDDWTSHSLASLTTFEAIPLRWHPINM